MNGNLKFDFEGLKKKKLKYFTFEDAIWSDKNGKIIKDKIWMYMINIDKNTGKSTEEYRMLKECCNKVQQSIKDEKDINDRFLIIFRTKENMDEMNSEFNNNDDFPFMYEKKRYRLKEYPEIVVGKPTFLGTGLEKSNGQQFKGYRYIFFDEYRSKVPLSPRQRDNEFNMLGRFISTFERSKTELYFYLFGNNEAGADILAEGFGISKDTEYYINIDEGLAYFNFGGCFEGLRSQQKHTSLFTKYSSSLKDYIDKNIAMESRKGILDKKTFDNLKPTTPRYQLLFRGKYLKVVKFENIYLIESCEKIDDMKCYGILSIDFQLDNTMKQMDLNFIDKLEHNFRNDKVWFWKIGDRDWFSEMLIKGTSQLRLLPEIKNML